MESTPKNIREYKILSSLEILSELQQLAESYPNLVTLTSSQELYHLPAAGYEDDCPYDREGHSPIPSGCKNYIVTLQDKILHPPGSYSYRTLPEVFLSGALHGDERVGPTAVVEVIRLIAEATDCEGKPKKRRRYSSTTIGMTKNNKKTKNKNKEDHTSDDDHQQQQQAHEQYLQEMEARTKCIQKLYDQGITDSQRKWLSRLGTTRRIVIVPTANAVGYFRNQREELNIDANRDFPYDLVPQSGTSPGPKFSNQCMQTIAGRTINEIFRQHLFQLSLTFHGGMEVIAYEWGSPTYEGQGKCISPDDYAQYQIAQGYSTFAGSFGYTTEYNTGAMNPLVYSVRGGMEDWAYAASWDEERAIQCNPTQFGGYNASQTLYSTSMLRVVNMLIETSNYKTPVQGTLGTSENILQPKVDTKANGHISRNIRLALMAIDIVQPYVMIHSISGDNVVVDLTDEMIPYDNKTNCKRDEERVVYIPYHMKSVMVQWTAGGGFVADSTTVIHSKWDDIPMKYSCDPESSWNFKDDEIPSTFKQEDRFTSGYTRWHFNGSNPPTSDPAFLGGPAFTSIVNLTRYSPGDKVALFAEATFDGIWGKHPENSLPHGEPPTSHVVNARTNANWYHQVEDKIIEGHVHWYSIPVTLIIGRFEDEEQHKNLSLLNSRFYDESLEQNIPGSNLTETDDTNHHIIKGSKLEYFAFMILSFSILVFVFLMKRRSTYRRQLVSMSDDDDDDLSHQGIPNRKTNRRNLRSTNGMEII